MGVSIREIESDGGKVGIEILRHGLDEGTAVHVESEVIDLLGFDNLSNRVNGQGSKGLGRMTTDDVNTMYGAEPAVFRNDDSLLLIRLAREFTRSVTAEELRGPMGRWWRLGKRREEVSGALAVHEAT